MKKLIIAICIAMISVGAFAQKGEKAVGVNLSYGTEISNLGIGVKGQYNFTDAIRAEAAFDYFLKKDGLKMWDINVNVHYLFPVAEKFKVYPLAGLTYSNWSADYADMLGEELAEYLDADDSSVSDGKIGVNLGVGAQYDINSKWAVNLEVKYQLISDYNQAVFGVGLAYKF